MYTYMPYGGLMYNPFGYGFYSPGLIYSYYSPQPYIWYGGGGAPAAATTGQPLSNLSTFAKASTGVSNSQISRLGSAAAVHPTLSNPAAGNMATSSGIGSAVSARGGSVGSAASSSASVGHSSVSAVSARGSAHK
jgi:hypothetical protein